MVSAIRKFPSMQFYEDRLTDAARIATREFPKYLSAFEKRNILFVDMKFSQETM